MPERNGELDQAHERFAEAQMNLQVTTLAAEELRRAGVSPGTVRVSIGLEDKKDLIEDLKQALG